LLDSLLSEICYMFEVSTDKRPSNMDVGIRMLVYFI